MWQEWHPQNLSSQLSILLGKLRKRGLKHTCLGLDNQHKNILRVKPLEVIPPKFSPNSGHTSGSWNYDFYKTNPSNTLIPLEFIFRFGTPKGSSLLRRLSNHFDPGYLKELGLLKIPVENEVFEQPIVEFFV